MARTKPARWLSITWLLLAAMILLAAAGACGRGHGGGRLDAEGASLPAKSVSVPPEGTANQPWSVEAQQDGGQLDVSWRGRNIGDYDLNGSIGVGDITPIAMNFGASVEYVGDNPKVPVE